MDLAKTEKGDIDEIEDRWSNPQWFPVDPRKDIKRLIDKVRKLEGYHDENCPSCMAVIRVKSWCEPASCPVCRKSRVD